MRDPLKLCCVVALAVPGIDLAVKLGGALAATVVEAFTVYLDDNLTVPLICGAVMQLMII